MKAIRSMVLVSSDPESRRRGSQAVYDRLQEEIEKLGLSDEITLTEVTDIGRHDAIPMVIVYPEAVAYGPISPRDVPYLVEEHLYKGRVANDLLAPTRELSGRIAWLRSRKGTLPAEQRIVLERVGIVDPESLEDYIVHNGYEALAKALTRMTPAEVYAEMDRAP